MRRRGVGGQEFGEVADDGVGAVFAQGGAVGAVVQAVDADDGGEAAAVASLDSGEGVLDDGGPCGRPLQPFGGVQEEGRVGLAGQAEAAGFAAVDDGGEEIGDAYRRRSSVACRDEEAAARGTPSRCRACSRRTVPG